MTAADRDLVEAKVQDMYRRVAQNPHGTFHFEMGEAVAERLGYPPERLRSIPEGAVESFAGVGYFFDLADLRADESVIDLGSGSGMDVFFAAHQVGPDGHVVGIDFTFEQIEKARALAADAGLQNVDFRHGRIDDVPAEDTSYDCVISNGVINLAPDKGRVFAEAARLLRAGGRLAIADIVTQKQLTDAIVRDADLWAACIGGASQEDTYRDAIESAGLTVETFRTNRYEFISDQARRASATYGVKSISVLATKPPG